VKVYLVTDGEYSDYRVLGAYTEKELAERARELWDADSIEDFDLDAMPPDGPPGMLPYVVSMDKDGQPRSINPVARVSCESVDRGLSIYQYGDGFSWCCGYVWARDEQHAVKIVNERRIALLASGRWAPGRVAD